MFDAASARPWLLVGCGYTGAVVAEQLVTAGAAVVVSRRNGAAAAALATRLVAAGLRGRVTARTIDLGDAETLAVPTGAVVVHMAPPDDPIGAGEAALARAAAAAGAHRIVYVSSTGVYAAGGGARVDEDWPIAPLTATGSERLGAEQALMAAAAAVGIEVVILRPAGIYGPGRGVLSRLRAGTLRIVGEQDTAVSRIHVVDLAAAIVKAGTVVRLPSRIYNVADREATPTRIVAQAAAEALGLPVPVPVPVSAVSAEVAGMLTADRRVDGSRLERELGWELQYPTWREGLAAELAADRGRA